MPALYAAAHAYAFIAVFVIVGIGVLSVFIECISVVRSIAKARADARAKSGADGNWRKRYGLNFWWE